MSQRDKLLVKILLGTADANIIILKYQLGGHDED